MPRVLSNVAAAGLLLTCAGAARADVWPFDAGEEPTLAPLLEQATPAVVNVSVVGPVEPNPMASDPLLRRFFDVPPDLPPRQGVGSGVIVDAEQGLILTNHHVVAGAEGILVVLADRREFDAELVGSDAGTDIAVLRIDADDLTDLPFAEPDSLAVGDFVVAIGNPFGLGQTATTGIVSALGRTGLNVEGYEDFIQTDASINPGNSGGALIDLQGALTGINTAIVSPGGGNVGIGFAVPSDMADAVMSQILEFGEVRRGRLGIAIQDVTPALADALSLGVDEGAIVTDVLPDSTAAAAGLIAGDVVVAIDGEPVTGMSALRNAIGFVRPGVDVALDIVRDGERLMVRANVGEFATAGEQSSPAAPDDVLVGAEVANIPPDHPQSGEIEGVLVTGVGPGSPAALSGLLPGDLITEVNRMPVASVAALESALEAAPSAVALTVVRGSQRLFVVVR